MLGNMSEQTQFGRILDNFASCYIPIICVGVNLDIINITPQHKEKLILSIVTLPLSVVLSNRLEKNFASVRVSINSPFCPLAI